MSDDGELSNNQHRKQGQQLPAKVPYEPVFGAYDFSSPTPAAPSPSTPATVSARRPLLSIDLSRIVLAMRARWRWLAWSGCALALAGLVIGWLTSDCAIKVTLVLRDVSPTFSAGAGESYRPGQLAVQTLVDLMTSPELARRVAAKANPPVSEQALKASVTALLGGEKDLVTLTLEGKSRGGLVALARLYAEEAVQLGRELQVTEISRMSAFYSNRIAFADEELARINEELTAFQKESGTIDPDVEAQVYSKQLAELLSTADSARIELGMVAMQTESLQAELVRQSPIAKKIEAAKGKLADLLALFTEEHPSVKAQHQQIASLEKQLESARADGFSSAGFEGNSLGSTLYLRLIELQTRKATLE
jgi:hypothetical protein